MAYPRFPFSRPIFFTALSCRSMSRKKRFSLSDCGDSSVLDGGAVGGGSAVLGSSFVVADGVTGRVESRVLRNSGN